MLSVKIVVPCEGDKKNTQVYCVSNSNFSLCEISQMSHARTNVMCQHNCQVSVELS